MPRLLACYQLLEYPDSAKFSLSLSLYIYIYVCVCVCVCVCCEAWRSYFFLVSFKTFEKPHKFVSAYLQVSIPLGLYDNLPVAISLLAKHGSDGFLLNLVESLYKNIQEEVGIAEKKGY